MLLGSIVLAGGESERFGQPKHSLEWRDSTLLLDRVETLLDCSFPVVVVARDRDQELPPLHTESELVFDGEAGGGPLVGVLAGMSALDGRCEAVIVVGCDFPFFGPHAVNWLSSQMGDAAGVVPSDGTGSPQPLCGIYRESLLPEVKKLVERGERKAGALASLPDVRVLDDAAVRGFDPDLRFLHNVNTPDDYRQAQQWMS